MCFFIMLQNHLILHLILLTQPEVTQCYEIVTHYPFRLYNRGCIPFLLILHVEQGCLLGFFALIVVVTARGGFCC